MSLFESAMKTLSKDEVIALALEYRNNFDSTLVKMQSELCFSRQVSSELKENSVPLE